jgi:outer membrane immunogenic protein
MKNLLLPALALLAVSAGSALAADLPRKAPMMAPATFIGPSWTGCYVGAGAGYVMFNNDSTDVTDPGGIPTGVPSTTYGGRGWFGTVQVGCDYQIGSRWVVGVFGDYDFSSIKGDHALVTLTGFGGEDKLDSSWAVGGRIGWLVTPQFLTYFSGGYTEASFNQLNLFAPGASAPTYFIADRTLQGWFIGSGVEYNFGWLPGLTWKTEYRVSEFDDSHNPILNSGVGTTTAVAESHSTFVQTVRSSLVWRWNWGR